MNIKLVCCAAAFAAMGLMACGDDTSGTGGGGGAGGGTGGSGGATTTTSSNGGGGEGGGAEKTCQQACEEVYVCASADSFALCPAWADGPVTEADWLNGPNGNDGCLATCAETPLLINLVNPDNCSGTITTLKGASPEFASSCEGAGGAGGAGGGV
jgi:hypothetical protein